MHLFNRILAIVAVVFGTLDFASSAEAQLTYTFTSGSSVAWTGSNYSAYGTLNLTLGFAPTPGTNLTVVKNTGLPFISGTFDGVPQGGTVPLTFNGKTYNYIANYYGGNGRSLILQWPCLGLAGWGRNNYGQLGDNSTINRSVPVAVNISGVLASENIIAVAGGYQSLAVSAGGKVFAWGWNKEGQLGNSSKVSSSMPVAVETSGVLKNKIVVSVAAGSHHSLALTSDGQVFAWGYNCYGQLGDGSTTDNSVPVAVNASWAQDGRTVVAIAAGPFHSLALTSDGQVYSWGWNQDGQLGDGSKTNSSVPVPVSASGGFAGKRVIAIAAGYFHSLALTSDGLVFAWGSSGYGQLGNNSTLPSLVPGAVDTSGLLAGQTVVAIAGGYYHSLALTSEGKIFAWGQGDAGQMGNGLKARATTVPVAVTTSGVLKDKAVTAISAGVYHSLALTSDGEVLAWGEDIFNQLGNNSTVNSAVPVPVTTGGALAAKTVGFVAGACHSLALFVAEAPSITANPVNQTTTSGLTAYFTAASGGIPAPTVQWQVSTTGTDGAFSDIVDNATATTGTLTLTNVSLAQSSYAYRAVFRNSAGSSTTNPATLSVMRTFAWFQDRYGVLGADPKTDPNHTGVSYLAAYAFGVDPSAPDRSELPSTTLQNGSLQISYLRWRDVADLTYVVEVSDDLQKWNSGTGYTQQVSVTPIDATREQIVERDIVPTSSAPRRFIRVRVVH